MPGPAIQKASLELPPNQSWRRSSWRDSLSWALGGGGRSSNSSQSGSSNSSEQSSEQESSAASAFSRLSVSTLLGLSGPSVVAATTSKPKGEKTRSLLRLLLKSQRSPESSGSELITDVHSLVPCGDVVGLLAVSVKQLKDFTPRFNVKRDTSLLIRISIDKIMKCTNPQVFRANQKPSKKITTINFGDVRYFSVKVPNQKSDPRNRIVLELVGFEGPKDFPRLFGTVSMHLYEVIQRQSFTEICALRIRNMVFCTVEVEFMFCYGSLGYGYSHQLKLPGADPAKAVACSMFMRVPPPPDRKDYASNALKPQLMDYPAFLSPDLNVTVGNVDLEAPADNSEDYKTLQKALKEPPRERLVKMKQEYRSLKTWREKAEYLDQLILKRGPKTKPGLIKASEYEDPNISSHFRHDLDSRGGVVQSRDVIGMRSGSSSMNSFELMEPDEVDKLLRRIRPTAFRLDPCPWLLLESSRVSRFKQIVGKVQHPLYKESNSSSGTETVIREENRSGIMAGFPESTSEIPVIPSTISEIPVVSRRATIDSDTDSERDHDFLESSDTLPTVPTLTVTSTASTHLPLDSMGSTERKIKRIEVHHESETSLSSSSGIPTECSESHAETGDSESTAFESPESKAVDEEPAPPAKKESVIEYPQSRKESHSRPEVSVKFADEVEEAKPSESVNKSVPQSPRKEAGFQEAVFSGDRFEPFLRHIRGVEPPALPKGRADEESIFSHSDKKDPFVETKEQEDQDPPHWMSPAKAASSSDSKLVKGGKQLSILRLIEKRIELEEEEPQLPKQMNEEPKPLAVKADLSQQQHEKTLSESEVRQVHISFTRSVEDFLVNRLTKVIALKSLLSKHVENLVEERLLEAEVSEELEDSTNTTEGLPDAKGKPLLVGRKPCSGERLSEEDISDLKAAASQNLQASLMGRLSAHGIIPSLELAENKQKVSFSSSAEEDLLKRKKHLSKESLSQADIITLKSLSDSQSGESSKTESLPSSQENQLAVRETDLLESRTDERESALLRKSYASLLEGANTETGLEKEYPKKSLEIIRVRLPMSTETESTKKSLDNIKLSEPEVSPKSEPNKTLNDALIEKLLKTEIDSLKSFLSKGLQDHLKDKLSEARLSTKDFEKVCQKLSLNVNDELTMALEKALPEGSQVSSKENLLETRATKQKSAFSESIQNFVLDTLSESEVANLKSVLNQKIQDHLLERLSEIGLITEEELRKVLENFFPVVTKETLPKGNNEKVSFKKGEIAHSTSSLTQSLQDRFSEEELKNLKSLLNRLLKEDHRDKLSESEIKGLTSVLQKNIKDLPLQSISETGISKEVEIKDECHSMSLLNMEESSPGGTTINVSEKEQCHLKDSLSQIPLDEKLGFGEKLDLPVSSGFEAEAIHKETQTRGFMSPPQKVALKGEKPDSSVNSVFDVETANRETQTSGSTVPPKKVKQSSKKESHRLPSSDKPDMPNSKRGCETLLRNKPFDEPLTRISEPFTSSSLTRISEPFTSSFLSAHDIGVQTEIKNYLSRPPGYFSKPTFPVNPQTFLFLHSESEEETKVVSKLHQKSKSRKRPEKSSKKDPSPHHLPQGVINTQVKKEKTTGGIMCKDVVKEKGRKHCEPPSPKQSLMDNKKDIKIAASPSVVRKESLKLKPEKKREEVKPKKSFSKTAAPPDPHLQNLGKNLPDKSSLTKFPASWRATGNTPNIPGILDLDMETFKHLEKAIERALIDLGKAPEGGPSQALHSARPSTAPDVAATAKELLWSLATNSSAVENPRIAASTFPETLDNRERMLKLSPDQLEVVLWILQNVLRQNTRSQSNG